MKDFRFVVNGSRTAVVVLLLLFVSMQPFSALAGPVSESEALQRAKTFLAGHGMKGTVQQQVRLAVKGRRAQAQRLSSDYYVFNVGDNGGFVVVSGDDRTVDILGYADSGSISTDAVPDGLRYLLDGYAEQIAWLEEHSGSDGGSESATSHSQYRVAATRTAIAPLIATHWNQGTPYNNDCPEIGGEKTVTGCVATSMAQLMYYHRYPTGDCKAIPGYTASTKDSNKNSYDLTVAGVSAASFSWKDMALTYSSTDTGTAAEAVAQLMHYCGVSLQMVYGLRDNGGSSSYSECIPEALKYYFGYDGGVRHAYRQNYSYVEWVNLIYNELANGRPVALGGQSMGGGHSFVCDGYDTDDYFHINWGWGGNSDGYFRLSVLQPREQGIGGSSTLDGFSFSQDAVIGIQPPVAGNKDYCLSLEALWFDSSDDASSSKTYTREAETDDFTGISLYYAVFNYATDSRKFEYAIVLADAEDNSVCTLYESSELLTGFNARHKVTASVTIPSTVEDGTYYIKVMSRPSTDDSWQECFDGDRYQLTAVVSDNTLTITVPIAATVVPTDATIAITTDSEYYLKQGYEQQVTASITGGAADYHGNIILGVNGDAVMGKMVDIPAGQTVDVYFSFIPTSTGEYELSLYTSRSSSTGKVSGTQIGSNTTVTIAASDATDDLDLEFTATIDNPTSDGKLYGNALRATVTVSNASTAKSYAGKMNCSVRKWTSVDNGDNTTTWSWEGIGVTYYPLVVAKEGSTEIKIARDGLETGALYSVRITYQRSKAEGNVAEGIHLGLDTNGVGSLEVTNGYSLGDATGATTIYPPAETIDAGTACFVDLRHIGSTEGLTVTPSSNPNCLYLLADGAATPDGLDGKNVVTGSSAASITLTDGNDFYTPVAFTAANISYTRTFDVAANETEGWNTIMLPFTVSSISCEKIGTVDWFHSADDTGNFWLRAFTGDGASSVTFDYTDTMEANTPYIIAVPDDRWGPAWQMTGRTVTFSGKDAELSATATASVSGNSYKFCGSTVASTLSNVYLLNSSGSTFVKTTTATKSKAFRGWFDAVSISSLSRSALYIASPETSGIGTIDYNDATTTGPAYWYTLDGRRLSAKPTARGMYIHQGKKYIIQ